MTVASLLAFAGCEREDDINPIDPITPGDMTTYAFSVSAEQHVCFAPGNLVYDSINGYQFATHQYDCGGFFGWGTGSNPRLLSRDDSEYAAFDDWGDHINGNWRTLTSNEWDYVIAGRTDAASKCGAATVCGMHGIVLLPDNWEGEAFNAGFDKNDSWDRNVYDASSWSKMETAGAIFLPAAGFNIRPLQSSKLPLVIGLGHSGLYWSSTPYSSENQAYSMYFDDRNALDNSRNRHFGQSVRLVRDI